MKERILTNWTLARVLYVLMGTLIIIQTVMDGMWIGVAFGTYFAAMGLFSFGCASGNCYTGDCATDSKQNNKSSIENVDFEEVKVNKA